MDRRVTPPQRVTSWQLLVVVGSYQQLLVFTGIYWQLLVVVGSYQWSMVVLGIYYQLLVVTTSCQQLLVVISSYQQLLVVTGSYQYLPGVPHLYVNTALGSTRSHRDLAKSPRVLGEISLISPKCLSSRRDLVAISEKLQISPSSWRDLVYLAEISFISARSRLSRRNIFHLARVSARSRQYLARDRFHLVPISEISQISPSS